MELLSVVLQKKMSLLESFVVNDECLSFLWGYQVSQKELKEALRRQWSQLSDKKRLKWISKALELQKDYAVRGLV